MKEEFFELLMEYIRIGYLEKISHFLGTEAIALDFGLEENRGLTTLDIKLISGELNKILFSYEISYVSEEVYKDHNIVQFNANKMATKFFNAFSLVLCELGGRYLMQYPENINIIDGDRKIDF